jgi:hypothetical protein
MCTNASKKDRRNMCYPNSTNKNANKNRFTYTDGRFVLLLPHAPSSPSTGSASSIGIAYIISGSVGGASYPEYVASGGVLLSNGSVSSV